MATCVKCGMKQGLIAAVLTADVAGAGVGPYYCDPCARGIASSNYWTGQERLAALVALSRDVIVTTTPGVDGFRVAKYLGIESVEFVIGTGVFSEVSSSLADFFGQRSSAFEKKLRQAKQVAMESLKFLAAERGANAVVAIDLDYTEFTGNRIALIINGTLVLIEPAAPTPPPPVPGTDAGACDEVEVLCRSAEAQGRRR